MGLLVVPQGPMHFTPLTDLGVAGDIGIHIDRTFGLDDVEAAYERFHAGGKLGKLVLLP